MGSPHDFQLITTTDADPALEHVLQPRLPPELERHIFEMCARCSRSHIPSLIQVARRVRIWIEPIQHEIVVFYGVSNCPYAYPKGRQSLYVEHLLVPITLDPDEVIDFVLQCPNLQDLALWKNVPGGRLLSYFDQDSVHMSSNGMPSPRPPLLRLSVHLVHLFATEQSAVNFNHAAFRHLTHFEILGEVDTLTWEEGNNFACLKELRYLAFLEQVSVSLVTKILEECEKLELVLLWPWEGGLTVTESQLRPITIRRRSTGMEENALERVVVMLAIGGGISTIRDWKKGADGKEDFWIRGQKILEQRRSWSSRRKKELRTVKPRSWSVVEDQDFALDRWFADAQTYS